MSQLHPSRLSQKFLFFFSVLLILSCEKRDSSVFDPNGPPPFLRASSAAPAAVNTDTMSVGPIKKPEDLLALTITLSAWVEPNSRNRIPFVQYQIGDQQGFPLQYAGQLNDDGAPPDIERGDGIYEAQTTIQIPRSFAGKIQVEIFAVGEFGLRSNSAILPIRITRSNQSPSLSNLQVPDTVKLASQDQVLQLRVTASDPDGLADIGRVVFNSFKPDGTPSSGNPFQMFDDGQTNGTSGDTVAGDGIFSLKILLSSSTATGTYRFDFQAFDKLNFGSNIITHRITVIQ